MVGDIDDDGDMEIVAYISGRIFVLETNGVLMNGWPKIIGGNAYQQSLALGDIDNDGDLEVIGGGTDRRKMYALHHNGTNVIGWPQTIEGFDIHGANPALGDIDKDGYLEIVVTTWENYQDEIPAYIHVWNHDGTNVTGFPKALGDSFSSPVLGDINGDGNVDILFSASNGTGKYIFALNHTGALLDDWPIELSCGGGLDTNSLALGDIDNDSDIEIIDSSPAGIISVWDSNGTYNSSNVPWPMVSHDCQHTGCANPIERTIDLAVFGNDITFSNTHPLVNESITTYATIYNLGNAYARNFTIEMYVSVYPFIEEKLIESQNIPLLGRTNATIPIIWVPQEAGNYRIAIKIKPQNNTDDNLSNNQAMRYLDVVLLTLEITDPTSGSLVKDTINITGSIQWDTEFQSMLRIAVKIDDNDWNYLDWWENLYLSEDPEDTIIYWDYEWNTTTVTNGWHRIWIKAVDIRNYSIVRTVRVDVYNEKISSDEILFEISMEKTVFIVGEPINVTATLTNLGDESITVAKMYLWDRSLDFEIMAPDGYKFHDWMDNLYGDEPIFDYVLEPKTPYSVTYDIVNDVNFGNGEIPYYNFTTVGEYSIQGIYNSTIYCNPDWRGELYSNTLNFTIVSPIDTDGDGIIDFFDKDDDNDSYNDTIEISVGTDSLDNTSIPLDMDNHSIPDGFEPNIDGDGIHNEDDINPDDLDRGETEDSINSRAWVWFALVMIILVVIGTIIFLGIFRGKGGDKNKLKKDVEADDYRDENLGRTGKVEE